MIGWVDQLLKRWGRWSIKSETKSIGYPSTSPMFNKVGRGGESGSREPNGITESDILDADKCIRDLPVVLRIVVIEYYTKQSSDRKTAERCGLSRKALSQYISRSHQLIAESLENIYEYA